MTNTENSQNKEYKDERFEFALYVNDNLITKRNFKINNFVEGSMSTLNFKEKGDEIVRMIDNDLKSKSRVYTWYYYNADDVLDEFKDELLKPWECTFKFVVTDNKNVMYSRIWDGYAYPKSIREKVDIANRFVKIVNKEGRTYTYEKEEYFKNNEGKLSPEMYVLKAMINDKQDLLSVITKSICEMCSPREGMFNSIGDYTVSDIYKTRIFERNTDGSIKYDKNGKPITVKVGDGRKYFYSTNLTYNKWVSDWAKSVSDKTKQYFANL